MVCNCVFTPLGKIILKGALGEFHDWALIVKAINASKDQTK